MAFNGSNKGREPAVYASQMQENTQTVATLFKIFNELANEYLLQNEVSCTLGTLELCTPEFLQSIQIIPLPRDIEALDNAATSLSNVKTDALENISQMFSFDAEIPDSLHFDITQPLDIGNLMPNDNLYGPPIMAPAASSLAAVFDDDCLSSVPSYSSPSNFCSPGYMNPGNSGIFNAAGMIGLDMHHNAFPEFSCGNIGIFEGKSIPRFFGPTNYQILANEASHLIGGGSSSCITSEIPSMDNSPKKLGKLTVEQRKEKIHKYMKKRNKRNFSKKIKVPLPELIPSNLQLFFLTSTQYACRKTLADSRPRVRGRFARNDDFGESSNGGRENCEEEDNKSVEKKGEK